MQESKSDNKGMAMVIVVCIMAVMVALSLALLAASSVLISNAQNASDEEQVRIFTLSVSRELEQALTQPEERMPAEEANGLWTWVNAKLNSNQWPEFQSDGNEAALQKLTMEYPSAVGDGQVIRTCEAVLYWECLGKEETVRKLTGGGTETITETDLQLTIRVTCSSARNSYTISSVFGSRKLSDEDDYYWYVSGRE